MTTTNAITPFNFNTHAVRVIVQDGNPWFVAKDVCDALGYSNSRKTLADHLDDDEKGVTTSDTLGGTQKLTIINESGLYALVLRSHKPEARKFAKWVTSEVLPSIRKTGSYSTPYSVQPGQTLSAEQAQALRSMIETQAKRHYSDTAVQGRYIKTVWSKLKSHFKVPYRQIPADEFTNAISIVVRHEVEWELVDDEPKASTLNETVAHLVKQLEAPNGAPAIVFMPLVNAVLRKQGFQFLPDSSRMLPSHQADEVLVRLNRLAQLFHPFSEPFMDVIGVLRALRGLGPKLGMHEPSYHQVIERVRA